MHQGDLELDTLLEDHGVCSGVIADSLALEWTVHERSDLAAACAFPPHVCGFTLQIDLTHSWSDNDAEVILLGDILALAAAVFMFMKLHPLPQQRYLPTLPELLTAVAELLTRQQNTDAPVLYIAARNIQQVSCVEFQILEELGFELAAVTPAARFEVFSRRFQLWQQEQLLQQPHLAVPPAFLADFADQIIAAHIHSLPFSDGSTASQIGAATWFVAVLLWLETCVFAGQ